jgi:hypothetical protein
MRAMKISVGCGGALAMLLLAGCSTVARDSVSTLVVAVKGTGNFHPTPEMVAATPYAQLLVEGPLGNALMVLGNDDSGRTAWYSNDKRVLFLEGALLVGTQGQPQDATRIAIDGPNPLDRILSLQTGTTVQRRYDWMPGYRFDVAVTGTFRRMPPEEVKILDRRVRLEHFEEQLEGPGVSAKNEYWADPSTGRIVRSLQLVAPGQSLLITTLKPYQPKAVR